MLTTETIDKLIGVEESFHASYKLTETMQDKQTREKLFRSFLELEKDMSYDWFFEYFQNEHGDRKNKKQDFTPSAVSEIMNRLLGDAASTLDMCSGVGGLIIKRWADNKDQNLICEEFSDRALPFLLFNLAIRNTSAIVRHGDSLKMEYKAIYKLTPGKEFSGIELISEVDRQKVESVIMNPPYSLGWKHEPGYAKQERFKPYEKLAPQSKGDYAFLLTGLNDLNRGGKMAIILPHGVLFRGSAEGHIRQKVMEFGQLEAIIGLPPKLFYNTNIPTVVLVLSKKENKNIFFIDASKEFKVQTTKNVLEKDHIDKIINTYQSKVEIEKYSRLVDYQEIRDNDYNLNIPRYIDNFEEEFAPELVDILRELEDIDKEIERTKKSLGALASNLSARDEADQVSLKNLERYLKIKPMKLPERGQLSIYDKIQT